VISKKKVVANPANSARSIHPFVFCLMFIDPLGKHSKLSGIDQS
jgi:hypothetical protein